MTATAPPRAAADSAPRPFGLLAELTHRCPLHCPYCSNPLTLTGREAELPTAVWARALREAADLGVLQLFLSGGEPLLRSDLAELVSVARDAGLYSNLITSGYGLTRERLTELRAQGLDAVQLSLQGTEAALADEIAGLAAHARKLAAAQIIAELGVPLTLNVVLHRRNLHQIEALIALAEQLGAVRLELANVQFYGWAFENQAALLPLRAQVEHAAAAAAEAQARLRGKMEILYVVPDYFGTRPKPCMHGWGQRQLTIDPAGFVLPCPTARSIPELRFDSIQARPLAEIWERSDTFNRFRGTAFLPEPCQSCERRELDFGGCRCQAALLTGDATRTDPACELSPDRQKLIRLVERAQGEPGLVPLRYRSIS